MNTKNKSKELERKKIIEIYWKELQKQIKQLQEKINKLLNYEK